MPINEQDMQRLRGLLDAREAELRDEVDLVDGEDNSTASSIGVTDVDDAVAAGQDRISHAIRGVEQDRDKNELVAIAAARDRMADGSYGECIDCGVEIPMARLEVQPTAERCIEDQERFEHTHPTDIRLPPSI